LRRDGEDRPQRIAIVAAGISHKAAVNYLLIGVLMIGGPAVYAMAGVFFCRKLLHGRVQEGHNDVCVPIFLNAGVLFAVLLGFMVIAVWESFDAAKPM
jgi:hypothetical protein